RTRPDRGDLGRALVLNVLPFPRIWFNLASGRAPAVLEVDAAGGCVKRRKLARCGLFCPAGGIAPKSVNHHLPRTFKQPQASLFIVRLERRHSARKYRVVVSQNDLPVRRRPVGVYPTE